MPKTHNTNRSIACENSKEVDHAYSRRQCMLGVCALAALAGQILPSPAKGATDASAKTRLILLGTAGGPTPKSNRAAPAQVVVVKGRLYVFDAGNGVARQLTMAGLDIGKLKALFLTHHHSDHNADIGNVLLLGWAANLATPVTVAGPPPLRNAMAKFFEMNAFDIQTRMADEGRQDLKKIVQLKEFTKPGVMYQDDLVKVTAARVSHPPVANAFAYRIDTPNRSIVFSGDTAPSENLVTLAQGADIMVHEVMHLPSLEKLIATEPNAKTLREHLIASHTSTDQVGKVATDAGVKTLVLSHFVPGGYPFLADNIWYDAVRPFFKGELIIGRDLMEI
jgi:ribonuclease BN (tRNA processing enzyme)